MLIDFHTHIFPDAIAGKTVDILKNNIIDKEGSVPTVYADATEKGLLESMKQNNVDISVVMPIATTVRQADKINSYAEQVSKGIVISFGSVHPMQENWEDILENICSRGLMGIKLHPEYQQFYIDSPEALRVLRKAEELNLMVMLHAGADIGMAPPVHCPPERLKNALSEVSGKNIIAAHLGGFRLWDDVEKYLVGTDVFFDTAFTCDFIEPDQYKRIIETHGCDKILFGTDSPWESPNKTLSGLIKLGICNDDLEKIKYRNALNLIKKYKKEI